MTSAIKRRLEALEQRAGMDDEQVIIIICWGRDDEDGLEVLTCRETGQKWERGAGESRDDFLARVKADLPLGNHLLFSSLTRSDCS